MSIKFWKKELSNIGKAKIGDNVVIHSHCWIGDKVIIGNNVRIQAFSFIPDGVIIEDDVFIGPGVIFTNDKLPPSKSIHHREILVKKGVSIGGNATILPGIIIAENSMIGAGSVVTKDTEENKIYVGNPAKVLESQIDLKEYKCPKCKNNAFIEGECMHCGYKKNE